MIGFSNTSWVSSPSRKPKPPPKPLKMSEHKSATFVDPPPYKKKRQEESEENKGIESKKAAPKSMNPRTITRVTPVSSALSRHYSSIKKHVLCSSRGQQISPKPQPTAVAPTHKRGVSSTFKKEDSDSNILKKPKPAKSVIPGTGSKSAATRRVTSTRAAALVSLDSNVTEQKSPKPLKTTEPVTKKRQEKSVGEKGLESPTATAKPIIPGSKSQATRSTPTSAAPSPRSSSVESSPLHSNTSSPRDSKIEKHLPNGDLYIGCFSRNFPHGTGKYLWKDGSMYEGEWKRGKAADLNA